MIIVMNPNAPQAAIDRVVAEIERMGGQAAPVARASSAPSSARSAKRGSSTRTTSQSLDGVEKVVPIMKPYKLASREFHEDDSVVEVGGGKRAEGEGRRHARGVHRRAVRGRERADAQHDRPPRPRRRRDDPPRRRLQAAHVALLLPGPRRARR